MTLGVVLPTVRQSTQAEIIDSIFEQDSVCSLFQDTVSINPGRPALTLVTGETLTWGETAQRVREIAQGLAALGVGRGDTVALLFRNIPDFHLADLAVLHLGAAPASLYPTDPLEKMASIVDAAGASVLVTEAVYEQRARDLAQASARTLHVADTAPRPFPGARSIDDLAASDVIFDFDSTWRGVNREDVACLLYTSGTTGSPKGVEIPHRAVLASLANYADRAPVTPGGRVLSYLPAAHIADRFASHYSAVAFAHTITCVPDPADLFDTIRKVRPTHFFTVPRVLEKLHDAAVDVLARDPDRMSTMEQRRAMVHDRGYARHQELSDPVFADVRTALGLDKAEWLTVGSAPSTRGVVEHLAAIGLPFADIWGLTEIMVCTMNPPEEIRFGTIGKAFERASLTVAEDGELLARGPSGFLGYRNDPARTAESVDSDGWVHTGDLASIDDEGYVRIIGRKKEIMINSAGKNMSPLEIEGALKASSALIDHAAAVGDGRRYVTAVIALDGARLQEFATTHSLSGTHAELARHPLVTREIDQAVARANEHLPRVEHVRKWYVAPDEWLPGGGEVTASMKLIRTAVLSRYCSEIEAQYDESA
jgi:long-chain acyl-CoA synthetase